jgi:hypothetical protein
MSRNSIFVIQPYWSEYADTWCFDDAERGIVREPFLRGIPEIIDLAVRSIPNSEAGFRLKFSDKRFAKKPLKLKWVREESGWNVYVTKDGREGALCPVLLEFFDSAPRELFAKAEAIPHDVSP